MSNSLALEAKLNTSLDGFIYFGSTYYADRRQVYPNNKSS